MRHLVTFILLLAAMALYFSGIIIGAVALFAVGMVCELFFWIRLFTLDRRSRTE